MYIFWRSIALCLNHISSIKESVEIFKHVYYCLSSSSLYWFHHSSLNSWAETDSAALSVTSNPSLNPCEGSKTTTFSEADRLSYDTHYTP